MCDVIGRVCWNTSARLHVEEFLLVGGVVSVAPQIDRSDLVVHAKRMCMCIEGGWVRGRHMGGEDVCWGVLEDE